MRVVAILAGGKSLRMESTDKALVRLGGARLIDIVLERLEPQADRILISGAADYGTGLTAISDGPGDLAGPAAGIVAVARWLTAETPPAAGFFTTPVDAPFLPADLVARLGECGGDAIAADAERAHPTFAYWTVNAVLKAKRSLSGEKSASLHALAEICGARRVLWPAGRCFFNVNTPHDLAHAARILASGDCAAQADR